MSFIGRRRAGDADDTIRRHGNNLVGVAGQAETLRHHFGVGGRRALPGNGQRGTIGQCHAAGRSAIGCQKDADDGQHRSDHAEATIDEAKDG